jgi:hypothetical protein
MLSMTLNKLHSIFHQQELQKSLAWVDTITEADELEVLKKAADQLTKINFDVTKMHEADIDAVIKIDKKLHLHANKMTHQYLTMVNLNKSLESEVYNAVYSYHRLLCVAYTRFLETYLAQKKTVLAEDKLNLILCLNLNATFAMAKWRYFDDQAAPTGTWINVCKIIKCAENLSMLNTSLFMYEHQKKETSVAALLKRGFMLSTLQKGNYNRLQIQLADQVMKTWATNPLILNKYKQDIFQFSIDVNTDSGPTRIRGIERFADYRFWKTSRLVDNIEAYLCAVDLQKPLQPFGLEKLASVETIVQLFKKLRVDWCVKGYERQRRSHNRVKRNKLITIHYGLDDICSYINEVKTQPAFQAGSELDVSWMQRGASRAHADANQSRLKTEQWMIVDESIGGFAVDLGGTYSSWIEPGKLVSYTIHGDADLLVIAEIKSIKKQKNGAFRAGLAVLTSGAATVEVERLDRNSFSEPVSGFFIDENEADLKSLNTFVGLFLDKNDDSKGSKASIIVPRSEYKRGNKLSVNINGNEQTFEMGAVLMKQRDWVRVALPI